MTVSVCRHRYPIRRDYMKRISHRLRAGKRQAGITLLETLVALGILGTVAVAFIDGVAASSRDVYFADDSATAESLARSQMEYVKSLGYSYNATDYTPADLPAGGDYSHYAVTISAEALTSPDDGIQKITVEIDRNGNRLYTLEGYKVDR